jgi:carboxylesterase type B
MYQHSANASDAPFKQDENILAMQMAQMWSSFATNGIPTSSLGPAWPTHTKGIVLVFFR